MLYFFDTEFHEEPGTIELISIGIVSEDSRRLYLESSEFDASRVNDFVKENVLPKLGPENERLTIEQIKNEILKFIGDDVPTFVAYYAAYDWVVFCWIFGRMVDLPSSFPKICWDLKQDIFRLGNPQLAELDESKAHNALSDAEWNKDTYDHLVATNHLLAIPSVDKKARSGILDIPRKTLNQKLWVYESEDDFPTLNPQLREQILDRAKDECARFGLSIKRCFLYGGSASFQYSKNSDIDVSIYAKGTITKKAQDYFRTVEFEFQEHDVHFFLKDPGAPVYEVSEAVYDVYQDEWLIKPLILPEGFIPEEYFKPVMKLAEKKAAKLDLLKGALGRIVKSRRVAQEAEAEGDVQDPEAVIDLIDKYTDMIEDAANDLTDQYEELHDRREELHQELLHKVDDGGKLEGMERFQEPEVTWKYLDQTGYLEFIKGLKDARKSGTLDRFLDEVFP